MDKADLLLFCDLREIFNRKVVDAVCFFRFALGLVYGGIGGTVDDGVNASLCR
jgi:hypothetical protein